MIKRFRLTIFSIILFTWGISQAQDPQFSQFYANPLYLNPALAGFIDCGRVNLNYRNQWPSLSNAYITYSASYDQNIPGINSGFGILAMSDRQGDGALVRNSIAGFYSYHLQVSEPIVISFGIEGRYYQEALDWNKLVFADQIDPTTGNINPGTSEAPPTNDNIAVVDFAAGAVMSYTDQWFVGIAVHHLTEPNISFYDNTDSNLPMKFTIHGGVNVNLSQGMLGNNGDEDWVLEPQLLYMQQEGFRQLNAGLYLSRMPLVLGAWFRHNFSNPDAFVALIGLRFNNIRFGYSYDATVSNIGGSSGGAHEISFAWNFCIYKQEKRRRIRAINSPSF
jgi:type IX secretion system PorP/SprF family membrane protein